MLYRKSTVYISFSMGRKRTPMSEGKKNIISMLFEEYNIETAIERFEKVPLYGLFYLELLSFNAAINCGASYQIFTFLPVNPAAVRHELSTHIQLYAYR